MVTYGPWVQADDYTVTRTYGGTMPGVNEHIDPNLPTILTSSLIEYVSEGDWINATYGDLLSLATLLLGGPEWPPNGPNPEADYTGLTNETAVAASWTYFSTTSPLQRITYEQVATTVHPRSVSAYSNGVNGFYPPSDAEMPADAIGFEFADGAGLDAFGGEMAVSEARGVELLPTTTLQGDFGDETVAGATLTATPTVRFAAAPATWESDTTLNSESPWSFSGVDRIVDWNDGTPTILGFVAKSGATDTGRLALGETIDLSAGLDEHGRLALVTINDATPPPPSGSMSWDAPHGDGWRDVRYGWSVYDMTLRWTFRPPPFRWIFDGGIYRAPRRVFPRDDGLTGGARRTWPPSKGYQWGNRVDGSGYL